MCADAVEAAAREGARLALADVASSGAAAAPPAPASEEVQGAVAATLAAVRQLEAAMSARLEGLAALLDARAAAAPPSGARYFVCPVVRASHGGTHDQQDARNHVILARRM